MLMIIADCGCSGGDGEGVAGEVDWGRSMGYWKSCRRGTIGGRRLRYPYISVTGSYLELRLSLSAGSED